MQKSLWLSMVFVCVSAFSAPSLAEVDTRAIVTQAQVQAAQVNLNTADAMQLQRGLSGVGAVKAQAIVDYRTAHGDFTSIDELLEVKGIGAATLERNRDRLTLQ